MPLVNWLTLGSAGTNTASRIYITSFSWLFVACFFSIVGSGRTTLANDFVALTSSPALLILAVLVGVTGLWGALRGLLNGEEATAAFGIDIVCTYSIAIALAYAFGGGVTTG